MIGHARKPRYIGKVRFQERAYEATSDGRLHYCGYARHNGGQHCSCQHFQKTGKRCVGLRALAMLDKFGSVVEYNRAILVADPGRMATTKHRTESRADETEDQAQLRGGNILGKPLLPY